MGPSELLAALRAAEAAGETFDFLPFWGHSPGRAPVGPWVLSNWWGCRFEHAGVVFSSAEAALMFEKARLFGDEVTAGRIVASTSPRVAKDLGRLVSPYVDAEWAAVRFERMLDVLVSKFSSSDLLRDYLVSTAPAVLVEASPYDRIWGVGLGPSDPGVLSPLSWRGANLLGFALTDVRSTLSGLPSPLDALVPPGAPGAEQLGLF